MRRRHCNRISATYISPSVNKHILRCSPRGTKLSQECGKGKIATDIETVYRFQVQVTELGRLLLVCFSPTIHTSLVHCEVCLTPVNKTQTRSHVYFQDPERDCSFMAELSTTTSGAKVGKIGKTIVTLVNDDGEWFINVMVVYYWLQKLRHKLTHVCLC